MRAHRDRIGKGVRAEKALLRLPVTSSSGEREYQL
jgi:hypothetical protein